jgi:hypothetical protein
MKPMVSTPGTPSSTRSRTSRGRRTRSAQGKQERHFKIEDDEQDRDQIEADIEFHAGIVKSVEAALVGGEFFRIGVLVGDQKGATNKQTIAPGRSPGDPYRSPALSCTG